MAKFPKTLHVKIENRGSEDECIVAWPNTNEIAEVDEAVACAIYKLVSVGKVVAPSRYVEGKKKG